MFEWMKRRRRRPAQSQDEWVADLAEVDRLSDAARSNLSAAVEAAEAGFISQAQWLLYLSTQASDGAKRKLEEMRQANGIG